MNVLDEADMENGGCDEYDEELPDTILDDENVGDENVGDLKEDSTNNAEEAGDAVVSTSEMEEVSLGVLLYLWCWFYCTLYDVFPAFRKWWRRTRMWKRTRKRISRYA